MIVKGALSDSLFFGLLYHVIPDVSIYRRYIGVFLLPWKMSQNLAKGAINENSKIYVCNCCYHVGVML